MDNRMNRLLCFGDSLTRGYVANETGDVSFHPYSDRLQDLLGKKWDVEESGVNGETTHAMIDRLDEILSHAKNQDTCFDVVCILGGTNDLGQHEHYRTVFDNLKRMYESVLMHHSKTKLCVITIPENGCNLQWLDARRDALNDLLFDYVSKDHSREGPTENRAILFDLEYAIPLHNDDETGVQNIEFWSDTLHFSKSGYEKFAEQLFEKLCAHNVCMQCVRT